MTENHYHGRTSCAFGLAFEAEEPRPYSPVTAETVADFILTQFARGPEAIITITRLQGLLFRAQGHHLARFGTPLFPEEIHKSYRKPVVPVIEERYREQAENTLERYGKYFHCFPKNGDVHFPSEVEEFLQEIWNTYGDHHETVSGVYVKVGEKHWEGAYYPEGVMDIEAIKKQFSTPYEPITDR